MEREASKPLNWGKIFYERQLANTKENRQDKFLRHSVRSALEKNASCTGSLDGSVVLNELNDDELCAFFAQYPSCEYFSLRSWTSISNKVLRCISITFAERLIELDLSGSKVSNIHLDLLLVRCTKLEVLKLNHCPEIEVLGMTLVVRLLQRSLRELYLSDCREVRCDALLWIAGAIGPQNLGLRLLQCLDLSYCPIVDKGFVAIPHTCNKLQFLNLQECAELTDESVLAVAKHCRHLQLLNLSGCMHLSDKAASSLGSGCRQLVSLNISRCPKISDKGIRAIATGCVDLQAANLAGLSRLSEEALHYLAHRCPALLMLNVTGCERVSVTGLEHLVKGLHFVEQAVTFMGFKPVDEHVEKKLEGHLLMLERTRQTKTLEQIQREEARLLQETADRELRENSAASLLQAYMHRYKLRMHYYRLWRARVKHEKALMIQRNYRGLLGRHRADRRREELRLFYSLSPFGLCIQKAVRGYLCRCVHTKAAKLIREMYINRRKEAENGLAVKLQAQARRFLAALRVRSWKELVVRRALNSHDAAITMQRLSRMFVAKLRVSRRRQWMRDELEARNNAGLKIKVFLLAKMRLYKSKLTGDALKTFYRHKWGAITKIQQLYRSFKARESVYKMKIGLASMHYAATLIQRCFRGSRILHWRDMRLNVIAAFVLDRQYLERRGAVELSRLRYKKFLEDNQCDSASEPDDDAPMDEVWVKQFDKNKKANFWVNYSTNVITYDEPQLPLAHEMGLIGKRIKVFWVVQGVWYEGQISKYHRRKGRHRVEYDDGDHEWIHLADECDRVQIQLDDGTWAMYVMYQSEAMLEEKRKVLERQEREDFKRQAFIDAQQWKMFTDDRRGDLMFMSTINGELRAGLPNAGDWVVQDDGYGFPCFFNVVTQATVYEDPRFVYDVDEDLAAQRKYVMQEVRYALYFCKDLWEDFEKASSQGDERQLRKAMLAVKNSSKIDHLNSFVIRAKALYQQVSVVDKPLNEAVEAELQYAAWVAARLAEARDRTHSFLLKREDNKREVLRRLQPVGPGSASGEPLVCRLCGRPTKRHLEFCPTCGKRQVFF